MNTSGDELDLPSYLSHLLSSVPPFCPVPAIPAPLPILNQASCAPASRLSYLLALFARHLQAWLSNGLWTSWTHLPCTPCPSHPFSVALNTISRRMSSTYLFHSLPHPTLPLECKCQKEMGIFILMVHSFIPSTLNHAWHAVSAYSSVIECAYEWPGLCFVFSHLFGVAFFFQNKDRHSGCSRPQ